MERRGRFLTWLTVLAAVWVFANRPRSGGALKRFLQSAGCPWPFASWHGGRLEWFDPGALAADGAVGAVLVVPVAWLCAWSRRGTRPSTATVAQAEPGAAADPAARAVFGGEVGERPGR